MPKTSSAKKNANSNIPIKSSQELIDEIVTKNQQDSVALDHYFKQNMKRVKGSGLDIYHKFDKKNFYEFASVMKPIVLKVLNDKGLPTNAANDIVRQAALESTYGTELTGTYNLGGIKYFDTTGPNRTYTVSKKDNIRYTNFDNLYDYVDYKVQLLNDRYNALESTSTDDFINRLHDGKYKYSDDKEKYQDLKDMKSLDRYLDYPYRFQVGGQFVAKRDGTKVVPIEVHEKVKMNPEQILRSKGLVPRQQTIREDKRAESQRKEDDRQGRMKYNDQKRKEEEAKINRGIWAGIGLGGLALAQATPAAPYIDGLMSAHGAYGLGKQADEGTLGLNMETAGNVLAMTPLGLKVANKIGGAVSDGVKAIKDIKSGSASITLPINKSKYYRAFYDTSETTAADAINDLYSTGIVRSNPSGTKAGRVFQHYIGPYFYKGSLYNPKSTPKAVLENSTNNLDWLPISPHETKLIPTWDSKQFTPLYNGVPNTAPIENFVLYQKGYGPITKHLWYKTQLKNQTPVEVSPFTYAKNSEIMVHTGDSFNGGPVTEQDYLIPKQPKLEGQLGYIWFNKEKPYTLGIAGRQASDVFVGDASAINGLIQVRGSSKPIGQWNGKSGFVLNSEYVTDQPVARNKLLHFTRDPETKRWRLVQN